MCMLTFHIIVEHYFDHFGALWHRVPVLRQIRRDGRRTRSHARDRRWFASCHVTCVQHPGCLMSAVVQLKLLAAW
jgi:hypothetical protein